MAFLIRSPCKMETLSMWMVTAYYKGFHGDLNETFVVGTVDEGSKKLIRTTLEVGSCVVTC